MPEPRKTSVVYGISRARTNAIYPLVAILNAAGLEQHAASEAQKREHLDCYGGAGGFPGHEAER